MENISSCAQKCQSTQQLAEVYGQPKLAKLLMICFIAEHNLPFAIADHMTELQKAMFPDSAIAQGIKMAHTTCTNDSYKFADAVTEDLAGRLRKILFSVIIDETTDYSKTKCMALVVKFLDCEDNVVKTRLLALLDVYGDDREEVGSSGRNLYNMVMEILDKHNIPRENFVGFAGDGTNSMMGEHNSVRSRLIKYLPGITVFKCICHSIHICASEAAKMLPKRVEDVVRTIYSHFSVSAKRVSEFADYQVLCDLPPHKFLHPSQTRWLSLQSAVVRIIEQWSPLKLYFDALEDIEKLPSILRIVEDLNDPSIFLYLHFLKDILPTLTQFNVLFQGEKPTIHLVYSQVNEMYKIILGYFCHRHLISKSDITTFDPANPSNHVYIDNIYLGAALNGMFQKEEFRNRKGLLKDVRERCQMYLIKLCQEIKKRFNMNDQLLRIISFLKPETLLDSNTRDTLPPLSDLVDLLPRMRKESIKQILDNEWRLLDIAKPPDWVTKEKCSIVHFFQKLSLVNDNNDEPRFKNLATFALQILALPVSNVDAERIFSKLKLIKTDIRNKLETKSVEALTKISEAAKECVFCYEYKPSASIMDYMDNN